MVNPKVKICGITELEDALACVKAGCEAIGFNFYRHSPRYIAPEKAAEICRQLPKGIFKIGVFVNSRETTIRRVAALCKLDILQFHGKESPQFCRRFSKQKVIKAFRVKSKQDLAGMDRYDTFAYLIDAYSPEKFGGTGKTFNWELAQHLGSITKPIFLSGGLNSRNVEKAICSVHPQWVDACTSVESGPGRKDPAKVREFVKAVKKAKG